jgi:hypothetical protein
LAVSPLRDLPIGWAFFVWGTRRMLMGENNLAADEGFVEIISAGRFGNDPLPALAMGRASGEARCRHIRVTMSCRVEAQSSGQCASQSRPASCFG